MTSKFIDRYFNDQTLLQSPVSRFLMHFFDEKDKRILDTTKLYLLDAYSTDSRENFSKKAYEKFSIYRNTAGFIQRIKDIENYNTTRVGRAREKTFRPKPLEFFQLKGTQYEYRPQRPGLKLKKQLDNLTEKIHNICNKKGIQPNKKEFAGGILFFEQPNRDIDVHENQGLVDRDHIKNSFCFIDEIYPNVFVSFMSFLEKGTGFNPLGNRYMKRKNFVHLFGYNGTGELLMFDASKGIKDDLEKIITLFNDADRNFNFKNDILFSRLSAFMQISVEDAA